jgi:hypothetical protein
MHVSSLDELRGLGSMGWMEEEKGWVATPEDIMGALSKDGFEECKRETTTSRRDIQPAGGVWQGVNRHTGSVASAIWVNRPMSPQAVVFITIDGVPLTGPAPESDPP